MRPSGSLQAGRRCCLVSASVSVSVDSCLSGRITDDVAYTRTGAAVLREAAGRWSLGVRQPISDDVTIACASAKDASQDAAPVNHRRRLDGSKIW